MNLEDVKQVEDGLYRFISAIQIDDIPWNLEYFEDNTHTALLFKRQGYGQEKESYLGGGYRAEFPFEIYVQAGRKDTRARLDLSRVLEAVWQALQEEQDAGFPNLELDDAEPQEVEITSLPADYTGEGTKLSTFYCGFKLIYEKKGKWN